MLTIELSCYSLVYFESTHKDTSLFHDDYLADLARTTLNADNKLAYKVMLREDKVNIAADSLRARIGIVNDMPALSNNPEEETRALWTDVIRLSRIGQ